MAVSGALVAKRLQHCARRKDPAKHDTGLLSYFSLLDGAQGRNRTTDTAIFSRMLYQLSYLGVS